MKRYIVLFIAILSGIYSLSAQSAIGSWTIHQAYQNVTFAAPAGNKIYALSSGALFSYDTDDHAIITYDKSNILSDQNISYINYCSQEKCLIIVYSNYNIDLLYDNETVYNISSYMDKPMSQNKGINGIVSTGGTAYLCTNFGMVSIDVKRAQIINTYIYEKRTNACTVKDNVIYAITDNGLIRGDLNDNLLEASNWQTLNTTVYTNILQYKDKLFLFKPGDGIYLFDEQTQTLTLSARGNYPISSCNDERMIASNGYAIRIYTRADESYYWETDLALTYLCNQKEVYWGCGGTKGLSAYSLDASTPQFVLKENIASPNGPVRNLAAYMTTENNRILVCGGGFYTDRFRNPGTIMQYKDHTWTSFQENGIKDLTGLDYRDIVMIAVNPSDSSHCFASSAGEGVYEFKSGQFVKQHTKSNSTLRAVNPFPNNVNFVRTGGIAYDPSGNLWVMNMYVDTVVNVLTAQGKWTRLFYPELKATEAPTRMMVDSRGRIWIACMLNNNGVFCIDTNGTLENTADDKTMLRSSYTNQDGSNISGSGEELRTYALAEDRDGMIWIGTAKGPLVVSNPSKWFDSDFRITQIKIPRNDGTNLADYLLAGERINDIAIDGGNRKWFATQNNGVYLISADGVGEIHHFTTTNSPLLSNTVQSITILPTTGEVFFGTDKGIISYQSDAIEAEESFSSDVHAFPNPVRSDYTGVIAIKGLVYDSDVKIVDAGGHLVCEGRSVGGLFTWDGRNKNGDRVSSGVYMVLASDGEGKEGVATKIVVIR